MSKSKFTFMVKTLVNLTFPSLAPNRIKTFALSNYTSQNEQLQSPVTEDKFAKYWSSNKTVGEVLQKADQLYEDKNYLEVYELLNRLKYNNNSEVKWRIARVLYQTTADNVLPVEIEKEMIDEAYVLLVEEATEGNINANVHKWFAIICDCHHRLLGLEERIKGYHYVLKHLRMAYKLDPEDITVCFLLGKLCFDLANLQGLKRLIAKTLYGDPPSSTYEEAYEYLSKVEELDERTCLSNIYYLGRTCYKMKHFYKAKHYLNKACCMKPKNNCEKKYLCKAKQLLAQVEKYTIGREILYPNCNSEIGEITGLEADLKAFRCDIAD